MRTKNTLLRFFTITLSLTILLAWGLQTVTKTRVIAAVDHPNGARLYVVQEFTYSFEGYNTSVYFDDGDGQWRWYYFDHDDSYWRSADSQIEGTEIHVTAQDRSIVLDTMTGIYTVNNGELGSRTSEKSLEIVDLPSAVTLD